MRMSAHEGLVKLAFFAVVMTVPLADAAAQAPQETASSWNWQAIGIFAAAAVALIGFFATYINNILLERRKANIAFISGQLEKLYGPLLALSSSTDQAWKQFQSRNRPGKDYYFDDEDPPTEAQAREFRHWMNLVLMPMNIKMQEVIAGNAHLIEGSAMPDPFLDFLAHVQEYRAVIAKWKPEDAGAALTKRAANTSGLNFPKAFDAYVKDKFNELKARQNELLAKSRKYL
jgi:hypothetical protein